MARHVDLFASDPDWARYQLAHPEVALKGDASEPDAPLDVEADRTAERVFVATWEVAHPLSSFGYEMRSEYVAARDGHSLELRIYSPLPGISKPGDDNDDDDDDAAAPPPSSSSFPAAPETDALPLLPLLFVTHGGGWTQGSHTTEAAWLLHPLLEHFRFIIVSVAYRMAPEHVFPTHFNDCWDALSDVLSRPSSTSSATSTPCPVLPAFDRTRVILAGSSAGGCLAAALSQALVSAQQQKPGGGLFTDVTLAGVLLNVPVTCHPAHFPRDASAYVSYEQARSSRECGAAMMHALWALAVPNTEKDGADVRASPLLAEMDDLTLLPPHLVYVAGQDPMRDDGLAYVQKLRGAGVTVACELYPGVPHGFARMQEELAAARKWKRQLIAGVRALLKGRVWGAEFAELG